MLYIDQRLENGATHMAVDTVTLKYDERVRGRLRATSDSGRDVGLFLERGGVLRDGDCLVATSGEIIRVRAANESVVTARVSTDLALARLCYHLGNRHVALAIGADEKSGWVRFPPDHVLEDLAQRLGANLERHEAPFDPEPGAYGRAGHNDHHHHGHGHAHEHDVHAH